MVNNNFNSNSGPWQPEEITPRQKLIYFIIDWVKAGATDKELQDILIPDFFRRNGIPPFEQWDIQGIIGWVHRKFPKEK